MVDGHGLHMYSGLVDASFQQLYNYRDLAAATGGDHRIARGRLARSCNPCLATAQDIERLLSEKGTRTIVDLRDAEEADTVDDVGGLLYSFATADEYGEVEGAEFVLAEGRTRHVLGGGLEKFSDIGEMPALRENMKRNWAERGSVYAAQQMDWAVVYRNFLSGTPDLWRRALQLCAAPENHPVLFHVSLPASNSLSLFLSLSLPRSLPPSLPPSLPLFLFLHSLVFEVLDTYNDSRLMIGSYCHGCILLQCSAGRDRTGILAMLVLHICGATQEEILRDYEASKCLARAEGVYAVPFDFTARQMEYFEARGFPADPSASQAMLEGIDRADMAATMVQLEDKYAAASSIMLCLRLPSCHSPHRQSTEGLVITAQIGSLISPLIRPQPSRNTGTCSSGTARSMATWTGLALGASSARGSERSTTPVQNRPSTAWLKGI